MRSFGQPSLWCPKFNLTNEALIDSMAIIHSQIHKTVEIIQIKRDIIKI